MATAVLINDTRVDFHHGCTRVIEAIHDLAHSHGFEIAAAAPAHADWRRDSRFVAQFRRADLVIVNGEGTLHHSQPTALPLLAAGAIARESSKRSALINFSWTENDAGMEKALLDFDLVSVRESRSWERVRSIRPDCRLVPDLSLCGPPPMPAERNGLGFGDSVLQATSLELLEAKARLGGRFVPIRFVDSGPIAKIRFARSYLSKKVVLNPQLLIAAARRAASTFLNSVPRDEDFLKILAGLKLFVTGRFHGATLALCASTPLLVAKSNTDKVEALLQDAGLEAWRIIEARELDRGLLERASQWHGPEKANIDAYVAVARREAGDLFTDLAKLVT